MATGLPGKPALSCGVDGVALAEDCKYTLSLPTEEALGGEPCNARDVRLRPNWPLWEEAMKTKLDALEVTGIWILVKRLSGNIVRSHWVYRLKHDAAGNIIKYKA